MDIILLERVAKLGQMGEVVKVKEGYARNFLLPQGKALRVNAANIARFEAEKASLSALLLILVRFMALSQHVMLLMRRLLLALRLIRVRLFWLRPSKTLACTMQKLFCTQKFLSQSA